MSDIQHSSSARSAVPAHDVRLPRVVEYAPNRWWPPFEEGDPEKPVSVVVPVSAVVTRECDCDQGWYHPPDHPGTRFSIVCDVCDRDEAIAPSTVGRKGCMCGWSAIHSKCGGSGTLEAIRYDPHGILREGQPREGCSGDKFHKAGHLPCAETGCYTTCVLCDGTARRRDSE